MPTCAEYYEPRPSRTPAGSLPFGVRSTGYFALVHPYVSMDKRMPSVQLFWCVSGEGLIELDGAPRVLKANQIAILYPGMRHYFYTDKQHWELYWLTLDGPLAVTLPSVMDLESGIRDVGEAPVRRFHALLKIISRPSLQAEMRACNLAFSILMTAAAAPRGGSDRLVETAVEQMHLHHASADLNIKTLSAKLGVHRTVLSQRFLGVMGVQPSEYLRRLRAQNAIALLRGGRLTIGEIAHQCGFADANYFARFIRQMTGMTPTQLRAKPFDSPT